MNTELEKIDDVQRIKFDWSKLRTYRNNDNRAAMGRIAGFNPDSVASWEVGRRRPLALDVFCRYATFLAAKYNDESYFDIRNWIKLSEPKKNLDNGHAPE